MRWLLCVSILMLAGCGLFSSDDGGDDEPKGTITGRVVGLDGQPWASAGVGVQHWATGADLGTTITDADGRFELKLRDAPAGVLLLTAIHGAQPHLHIALQSIAEIGSSSALRAEVSGLRAAAEAPDVDAGDVDGDTTRAPRFAPGGGPPAASIPRRSKTSSASSGTRRLRRSSSRRSRPTSATSRPCAPSGWTRSPGNSRTLRSSSSSRSSLVSCTRTSAAQTRRA